MESVPPVDGKSTPVHAQDETHAESGDFLIIFERKLEILLNFTLLPI